MYLINELIGNESLMNSGDLKDLTNEFESWEEIQKQMDLVTKTAELAKPEDAFLIDEVNPPVDEKLLSNVDNIQNKASRILSFFFSLVEIEGRLPHLIASSKMS